MNLKSLEKIDWVNQWDGKWSILSFSYWGGRYCKQPFSSYVDKFISNSIIFWRNERGSAYLPDKEREPFAKKLEKIIEANPKFPKELCDGFRAATEKFFALADKYTGKDINFKEYLEFQDALVEKYYPYHIEVKFIVDYLKPELLKKYLPLFEEARVYAEPVFTKSEEFMRGLAKIHAKKTDYKPELILCCTEKEFHDYFGKDKKLPAKSVLEERYKGTALLFDKGGLINLVTGDEVDKIVKIVLGEMTGDIIKGAVAYPGKVKGKAHLVFDPAKANDFKEGEILVTGMTRPEFLPLMKKAAAFVTDGGGILSHAAIVARELKKPCVIGTKIATKVLKDGDLVEVDAIKGVVKIIK